ncbi:hypothetical protein ACJMK2_033627 [Sinanodonta woodiana]|uniref:Calcium uniporter protein n=1 Tax=Sinanodonta woodiana TaxID=1069815 RepID=A0ABD3WNZ2_SINWO
MASKSLHCFIRSTVAELVQSYKTGFTPIKRQILVAKFLRSSFPSSFYCTSVKNTSDAFVQYQNGLPVFIVPLPSRQEKCEFTLKPIGHTVRDLIKFLHEEDGGIDRAAVYTEDGNRISGSTSIDVLLRSNFRLVINQQKYDIAPPTTGTPEKEIEQDLSDVKRLVGGLYAKLNVEQYQRQQEQRLLAELESLQVQIAPLEKVKLELEIWSRKRSVYCSWLGLGAMGIQFGLLARLTWWEYSWDIMEPVTYFVTYGTTMAMYAYFVLSKQEYSFPDVFDRIFLKLFYKGAKKTKLDVEQYNQLKNAISDKQYQLRRLQDPLQIHLPIQELPKFLE